MSVLAAGPVVAQDASRPPDTPHPLGRLRFGALSLTPNVVLADLGIDTNVFDLSGTERLPADFTTTIEPNLELRVLTRRLDARITQYVGLVYYAKYASERAINPMTNFSVDERFSTHFAVYARGSLGFTRDRPDIEVDERARRLAHSTVFGTRLGSRRLDFDLHGSYSATAYDDNIRYLNVPLAETLNHTTTSGGATVNWHLTNFTTVTAGSDYIADRFPVASERNADSIRSSAGFRFSPRAVISGDVSMGYLVIRPHSEIMPAFSGVTPTAGLSYRLGDFLSIGIGAQRDIQPSFYRDRPDFVYTVYEGSVQQAIFHKFDIGVGVQYITVNYRQFIRDGVSQPTAPIDRDRIISSSLGIPISRQIRLAWYVQQAERFSVDRPYKTIRAGLDLTVGRANVSSRGVFLHGPGR